MWGVIIPTIVISILGWFWFSADTYAAAWNPKGLPFLSAVGIAISITLWAFLSLESACANADAVENPERNVPIAVLGGTTGAAIIYIIPTNVIAGIVPDADLAASSAPFGLAYEVLFNATVANIIAALMVMPSSARCSDGSSPWHRCSRARPMSAIFFPSSAGRRPSAFRSSACSF